MSRRAWLRAAALAARRRWRLITAVGLVVVGGLLVIEGVRQVFPPAAYVLAGLGLAVVGLLAIDIPVRPKR